MSVLYALEKIRFPALDAFMGIITYLGHDMVFLLTAFAFFWCVNKRQGYYTMAVGISGLTIGQVLKIMCQIPRPWVIDPNFTPVESAKPAATGYSFPSGHTQDAVSIFGTFAMWKKKKSVWVVCIVIIALVALSRMYLGVHYPLDVIAALVCGAVLCLVMYPFFAHDDREIMPVFVAIFIFSVLYVVLMKVYPFGPDVDPVNLKEAHTSAYKLLGATAALCISFPLEKRYVKFEVEAPIVIQIVKLVGGLGLIMVIRSAAKAIFGSFLPETLADGVRYFLMVIFAGLIWPMAFKPLCRLASKNK